MRRYFSVTGLRCPTLTKTPGSRGCDASTMTRPMPGGLTVCTAPCLAVGSMRFPLIDAGELIGKIAHDLPHRPVREPCTARLPRCSLYGVHVTPCRMVTVG